MKKYIGTKIVNMQPMTRLAYNEFRGWKLPDDENGNDDGYLVEYCDGGAPNTPHYAGYVSWSHKAQAEAAYRQTDGMSFGLAIEALKKGYKVCRSGWNGKGMFLVFVSPSSYQVSGGICDTLAINPSNPDNASWIGMKTADNKFVPWLASQTDVLADDWMMI